MTMVRVVSCALAAGFCLSLAAPAFAADTMYPNDPDRQVKEQIEDVYGVYILLPSRRNPKEKVEINGDTVEMSLFVDPRWRENPEYNKMKCDAMKWILVGRFGTGGAQPFFNEFTKYNNVDLTVFKLDSTRTVDKDGKYTVTKTPDTIMRFRLTRKKAEKTDWPGVAKAMDPKNPDGCVRAGEKLVDRTWYSKEYFK